MEAILMDVKRVMRSLQGMMHAVSGALRQNGVEKGLRKADRRRSAGSPRFLSDVYGRAGRVDIYSGRDIIELYQKMAFNDKPLP